jgi:hypothetical protein
MENRMEIGGNTMEIQPPTELEIRHNCLLKPISPSEARYISIFFQQYFNCNSSKIITSSRPDTRLGLIQVQW